MIHTLNIKCVGSAYLEEPFWRTIEVSDEMTLGTLHDMIQELTGFDNDHLFTFFMARGPRGQRTSIIEAGQWEEERDGFYEMPLCEVFPLEQNMKLFYWFDFGDDWMFQIQQRRQPKPADSALNIRRSSERSGLNRFSMHNKNKNGPASRYARKRPSGGIYTKPVRNPLSFCSGDPSGDRIAGKAPVH